MFCGASRVVSVDESGAAQLWSTEGAGSLPQIRVLVRNRLAG